MSDGNFAFANAPSGNITIIVTKSLFQSDTMKVTLPVGGTVYRSIQLDALPQITNPGVVTSKTDEWYPGPVYMASVSAEVNDYDGFLDVDGNITGYGITDNDGSYSITGLSQGAFDVFTDAVGFSASGSASTGTTYNADGTTTAGSASLSVTPETPSAVKSQPIQATSYSLEQNYPNPFNPTTQIAFNTANSEHVNISVFNILGQKVATIMDGNLSSGSHIVMWDGRNLHGQVLPSGVYFYRLSTPNFTAVKKMILLK